MVVVENNVIVINDLLLCLIVVGDVSVGIDIVGFVVVNLV